MTEEGGLKYFILKIKKQDVFVKHKAPDNDHKDKYFDTSRKILSQEMTICNMEALVSYL